MTNWIACVSSIRRSARSLNENRSAPPFAKKLLRFRLSFCISFRKRMNGVHRDKEWGSGCHFCENCLRKNTRTIAISLMMCWNPCFAEALRLDRNHADDYYRMLNCRIPFLNGSLFVLINNYDWVHTDLLLPNDLFPIRPKLAKATPALTLPIFSTA